MKEILAGTNPISIGDVQQVARECATVSLDPTALKKINESRSIVEKCLRENKVVYGITTGFGKLADTYIEPAKTKELQRNLLLSHSIGVGEPFKEEISRAMLFLRLQSLAQGYSGVRPIVLEYLIRLLNEKISPVVPCQGSVGSSGDLAPLSHLALPIIGEGDVFFNGKKISAKEALHKINLTPLVLEAKEGLALINGTQAMTAVGTLAIHDSESLVHASTIAAAMSMEASLSSDRFLDERLHQARPHPGQLKTAAALRKILAGSQLIASHKNSLHKVQDAYSMRCAPQIHGPVHDALQYTTSILEVEINSVTDNPLIFAEDESIVSGGNFHGHPVSVALDFLKMALSSLANVSERRIERLVNPALSESLPAFLTKHPGIHSGMMLCQYTAAALVAENKVLSHPSSVDSIPTNANQEDYNSMGTIAARHLARIVENATRVVALELMCAAQALEFRRPLRFGKGVEKAYELIRQHVPALNEDRLMDSDLATLVQLIQSRTLLNAVAL